MYYYSVDYKTNPPNIPADLKDEIERGLIRDFESGFLFGHQNKLNDAGIKIALESYLKNNKIYFTELIITKSEEITEEEYIGRTRYS
jgi:hypothetical protein